MDPQTSPRPPQPPLDGGGNNTLRAAIMAVVMTVLAGYLLLWVMVPTNTYKKTWLPELRANTASTYFGTNQGANYLVFTMPVLFIAILGCVYLHLSHKSRNNNNYFYNGTNTNGGPRMGRWKRPVVMKGLGIVTRIELAFLVMFIALLIWSLATYLQISFAKITPKSAAKSGEKVWEARLETSGLRLGLVGNIALSFLFLPVTRGSSVLPLFGLTSEASVKYHVWLGHIVMTLFTAHGLIYILFWAVTHELSEMLKWENTGVSNVAGEISLLGGLILWATTYPKIRKKMFELFFYTHHLYILFVFFFVLHVGISYASMMLPGFFLFAIDRYLRFLQSRRRVRLVCARVLPCQTLELNFSKAKGLRYTPTSIMFVNVPSVSKLQWHPFTISSSSSLECDTVSVIIKEEGAWTKKLYKLLASPTSVDRLEVSIEGPYGPPSTDFLRHNLLVMISGGSGITPFISIIRELIHTNNTLKTKTPKIVLITAFKNSPDLTILDLILPITGATSQSPALDLQIEAYVTREKNPTTQQEKNAVRTIRFKPNPSDAPLAPILGPNSWLWLGAIISSSFVIYLVLVGIVTRYYIYPIDHNTNKKYSSASRAVLHVLFVCIGIIVTSTLGFLWNKSWSARETNYQIQNMELGPTPVGSPNQLHCADMELESLPQEAFSQTVNVHYGERPNLKRMLFERKENSVGVLVCGPRKLRHEVANICSSGLADNLHFESISFSW